MRKRMGQGRLWSALAVIAALAACTKSTPPTVIENVTHINGVPIAEYEPNRRDVRRGLELTVADPNAAPATVPATTAATAPPASQPVSTPAPAPAPEKTASTSSSGGTSAVSAAATTAASTASAASTAVSATTTAATTTSTGTSVLAGVAAATVGVFAPVVASAADSAPDGEVLSAPTFVNDDTVRVTLVDSGTGQPVSAGITQLPPAGTTTVFVSDMEAAQVNDALRAYANVCEVGFDNVVTWANAGGKIDPTTSGYRLGTDVCPGLWKFARVNR